MEIDVRATQGTCRSKFLARGRRDNGVQTETLEERRSGTALIKN